MPNASKILIIEDDRFLSALLKARLEKEGFVLTQAYDGEEAMTLMTQAKPDLIILDVIMPRLSGFEFLEKISMDPSFQKIPIMVLSNLGQQTDIDKVRQFGVVAYFVKAAMSMEDIAKKVKETLEKTVSSPS